METLSDRIKDSSSPRNVLVFFDTYPTDFKYALSRFAQDTGIQAEEYAHTRFHHIASVPQPVYERLFGMKEGKPVVPALPYVINVELETEGSPSLYKATDSLRAA